MLLQEKWYNGNQTDGVANSLSVRDSFMVMTGDITDYPRTKRYGVLSVWTPSGKDTIVRTTRPGSTILNAFPFAGKWLVAGAKTWRRGQNGTAIHCPGGYRFSWPGSLRIPPFSDFPVFGA